MPTTSPLDRFLIQKLVALLSQSPSLHGRRIRGAAKSKAPGDFITRKEVTTVARNLFINLTFMGTHAERLAMRKSDLAEGATFFENDRKIFYVLEYITPEVQSTAEWLFVAGVMPVTLFPNTKPSDLGVYDNGFRIYSEDFDHEYVWTGTDWEAINWGGLQVAFFIANPGVGWYACNGDTGIRRSTPTGGTTTFNVPNLVNAYARGAAAYSGPGQTAATAPGSGGFTDYASTGISVVVPGADLSHSHNLTAANTLHQHGWGNAGDAYTYTFPGAACVDVSTFVLNVSVLVCDSLNGFGITGNTSIDGIDGVTEVASASDIDCDVTDPTHRHAITLDATGQPAHIDFLPYVRL